MVGALLVLALLFRLEGPEPALRGDQQWGNLMALKHLHPDWLQGDVFFGPDYFRGYNPAFFSLQARIAQARGGDLERVLRLLAWPVGLLFLIGHYALFRYLTGSALAAALGAVSALVVRHALGGEYWGFGGVRDVLPRAIASGLAPLLVLVFIRLRDRAWGCGYFLLLGLAANLHPVSGLHLAQISAVTHLWLSRFRPRAWLEAGLGVPLFALGALPFILRYVPAQEDLTDPAGLQLVREALHYRYPYLLYPLEGSALVSVAFHAALPAGLLLCVLRWGRPPAQLRVLTAMGVAALGLGLGGIALIQAVGDLLGRPYVDIHQLRAGRFMYLLLLAAFPLAYVALLRQRTYRARLALAVLVLASLIPPGAVLHSFSVERREAVKRALGIEVRTKAPAPAAPAASAGAEAGLWAFVSQHTGRNELFFTDSFQFRYETQRPITGSFKDGGIVIAGTAPLYRWYVYMGEVDGCRRRRGEQCWFPLAERYGGRYAVVDPGLDRAAPRDGGWTRIWSHAGWSLWRRDAGR